jgi:hypothetical protein
MDLAFWNSSSLYLLPVRVSAVYTFIIIAVCWLLVYNIHLFLINKSELDSSYNQTCEVFSRIALSKKGLMDICILSI